MDDATQTRFQLLAQRTALLARLDRLPEDYASRRLLAETEAALSALDRADVERRGVCTN